MANFQLAQYIAGNVGAMISGKPNPIDSPRIVERIQKSHDKNTIKRYLTKEETEQWLREHKSNE